MLDDLILDEMLPDVLIEILTSEEANKDPSYHTRATFSLYEHIRNDVIQVNLKALVQESLSEMVDSYIRFRSKATDLVVFLSNELILGVVKKELRSLAEGCIHDLVKDFILERKANALFEQLLSPNITGIVSESIKEWELEGLYDLILKQLLVTELPTINIEVLEETKATMLKARQKADVAALYDRLSEVYLPRAMLDHLVHKLSTKDQFSNIEQRVRFLLNKTIAKELLRKHLAMAKLKRANPSIKATFDKLAASRMCDLLIDTLRKTQSDQLGVFLEGLREKFDNINLP